MKYRVTVKREDGGEEVREIEAPSRFTVYGDIEKEGASVVAIEEGRGGGLALGALANISIGLGIKTEERITFTKNLAAMLAAGLTLSRALSVIQRQSRNRRLKAIVSELEEEVKKGTSFHEALEKHQRVFSRLFIAMTKAGEESGTVAEALKVVARQMDRSFTLEKKIKGAMIYPSIILGAIVVIGVLMMIYVVPTLSATFKSLNVALPTATRIIIAGSDFMAQNVILVFFGLGLTFAAIMLFTKSRFGKKAILAVSMRLPVIGELVRETFAARAARSLSSLLSSGVEMVSAIDIAGEVVGENVFGRVLIEASERVKKGDPLSAAFADHPKLYPFFIADMIAVGEETGKVADMLGQVAEYYETDVEDKTKDLSTIIEPVLMLVIGVAVGIFALAMITPIYSLSSKI